MTKKFRILFKETFNHWTSHHPGRAAATLSFYATFSLIPLLVLLISLVSLFVSRSMIEGTISHTLQRELGSGISLFIDGILVNVSYVRHTISATTISIIGLLFGVTGIFFSLSDVLHALWEEEEILKRETVLKKILRSIKEKTASLSFLPILGLLLFLTTILGFIVQTLSGYGNSILHIPIYIFTYIDPLISFCLMILIFCLALRIFPTKKLPWNELLYGSIITAFLFTIGKVGINFYLSHSFSASLYGGAGSFAAILLWIYYSSQIFLFGASFTYIYSKKYGYLKKYHHN